MTEQQPDAGREDAVPSDERADQEPGQQSNQQPGQRASAVAPDHDFADEHTSTTYSGQQAGGPEGEQEPESPEGLSGMDP